MNRGENKKDAELWLRQRPGTADGKRGVGAFQECGRLAWEPG